MKLTHHIYYGLVGLFTLVAMPTSSTTAPPSKRPTLAPTSIPTLNPTGIPTFQPTLLPTFGPTLHPTASPSLGPSPLPTTGPSLVPSLSPTGIPTSHPTDVPSLYPTAAPSPVPSLSPTGIPTSHPTDVPSLYPTAAPSATPSSRPSSAPTLLPTGSPSIQPTLVPSGAPTLIPSASPTITPTTRPSDAPTLLPTAVPTLGPTGEPTPIPTLNPTEQPTFAPYEVVIISSTIRIKGLLQSQFTLNMEEAFKRTLVQELWFLTDTSEVTSVVATTATGSIRRRMSIDPAAVQPFIKSDPRSIWAKRMAANYTMSAPQRSLALAGINVTSPAMWNQTYVNAYIVGMHVNLTWRIANPSTRTSCDGATEISLYEYDIVEDLRHSKQVLESGYSIRADEPISSYKWLASSSVVSAGNFYQLGVYCSMFDNDFSAPFYIYSTPLPTSMPSPAPTVTSQPTPLPTPAPTAVVATDVSFVLNIRLVGFVMRTRRLDFNGTASSLYAAFNYSVDRVTTVGNFTQVLVKETNDSSISNLNLTSVASSASATVAVVTVEYSRPPSPLPTLAPTPLPTLSPSNQPSSVPTTTPSASPSSMPTSNPSMQPTFRPSSTPTSMPSLSPTVRPTLVPTGAPTRPANGPTPLPTLLPTPVPSTVPSLIPTSSPTLEPSSAPSSLPTQMPSHTPSLTPTALPSFQPTLEPTTSPTIAPTAQPTAVPSSAPTDRPTLFPSPLPSLGPTKRPTRLPTLSPTSSVPSIEPSPLPVSAPSSVPSRPPTPVPTQITTYHMVAKSQITLELRASKTFSSEHKRGFKLGLVNTTALISSVRDISGLTAIAQSNRRRLSDTQTRRLSSGYLFKVEFSIDIKLSDHGYSLSSSEGPGTFAATLLSTFTTSMKQDLYSTDSNFLAVFETISGESGVVVQDDGLEQMDDSLHVYFATANENLSPTPQPTPVPTILFGRDFGKSGIKVDTVFTYVGGGIFFIIFCLVGRALGPKLLNSMNDLRGKRKWAPKVKPVLTEVSIIPGHSGRAGLEVTSSFDKHLIHIRKGRFEKSRKARLARKILQQDGGDVAFSEY